MHWQDLDNPRDNNPRVLANPQDPNNPWALNVMLVHDHSTIQDSSI